MSNDPVSGAVELAVYLTALNVSPQETKIYTLLGSYGTVTQDTVLACSAPKTLLGVPSQQV